MSMLDLLTYPDERLKNVAEDVTVFDDKLTQIVNDLEDTMRSGPGSVGIAAPQVNIFKRIIIIDVSSKPKFNRHGKMILINPEIETWEGMVIGREGCLSVPDFTGNVIRAERITLKACDIMGNGIKISTDGFEARALQHEIDHLDGMLFLDRLVSRRNDLFKRKVYK